MQYLIRLKSRYSRFILITFTILCVTVLNCSVDNNPFNTNYYTATASFSFEENIQNKTRLILEGITGNVTVTGKSGEKSVSITGERIVESKSVKDAEEHLTDLKVKIQKSASEIIVATDQPNNPGNRNYIIHYTITLPDTMEVVIGLVTGEVTVKSLNKPVSVTNVTGPVVLDDLNANTIVSLVTGSIECKTALPLSGLVNLSIVTGNIILKIPESTSAEFTGSVVTGNINVSGIELLVKENSKQKLRGTFGDGQGTILLSTVTGNIHVTGF